MRTFLATLAAAVVQAKQLDSVKITIDGVETTKYLASDDCFAEGNSVHCPHGGRGFLVNEPWFELNDPNFYTPSLKGASIEFDVDLSQTDCGNLSNLSIV